MECGWSARAVLVWSWLGVDSSWRALKLDEQCEALLVSIARDGASMGGGDCDIGDRAALCKKKFRSSELHVAEQWYRTTALQ